jgi:hypothetical protein
MSSNRREGIMATLPKVHDLTLSTVRLDPRRDPLRDPRKSAWGRSLRYAAALDRDTLLYDIFLEPGGETAFAVGPPLPQRLPPEEISFTCAETGAACPVTWNPRSVRQSPHFLQIALPPGTRSLAVETPGTLAVRPIQPNGRGIFAGKRVLIAGSRNDDPAWIADRAWFHVVHHGFDAVLHYDNGSTRYTPVDVANALAAVPGLDTVVVIDWPFPMYPSGDFGWPRHDEQWGQWSLLHHARHRFLLDADVILWGDIDELLVRRGAETLEDLAASESGADTLIFPSQNVVAVGTPPAAPVSYRHFHWTQDAPSFHRRKWLTWPAREKQPAPWNVHYTGGPNQTEISPDRFAISHFLPMTTGWGNRANRQKPVSPDPARHREDDVLRAALDAAFSQWRSTAVPLRATPDPLTLNAEGFLALEAGDVDSALASFERSLALDPHQPSIAAGRIHLIRTRTERT